MHETLISVITENKKLREEINTIKIDNTETSKPKSYASAVLIVNPKKQQKRQTQGS
jgi:hypothetical protein